MGRRRRTAKRDSPLPPLGGDADAAAQASPRPDPLPAEVVTQALA